MIDLKQAFDAAHETQEFLEFERIANPAHPRRDICAFVMLDKLAPTGPNIIVATGHDEFYLATDLDRLAESATQQDIIDLVRCGVRYSAEGLVMFV